MSHDLESLRPEAPDATKEFFREVCVAMGRPAARCFLVDDDERDVRGARVAGLSAYRWSGPDDLPYLRATLGIG